MTAQQWEILRSQEELPLSVLFDFYKEKGGTIIDIIEFQKYLFYFHNSSPLEKPVIVRNNFFGVTYETILKKIYEHYDRKFNMQWIQVD